MGKTETKAYLEAWAKSSGKPVEEIMAEVANIGGYQKTGIPIPAGDQKLSPLMEAIVAASTRGEKLDSKAMFESMMTLKMMEMMGTPKQDSGQNVNDIIAKNNEMWERRLEQMKQEQREANLQRQMDDLKTMIMSSSGSKKGELADKFEKLTEKLDAEKEKRVTDAIKNTSTEIAQLREDMAADLEDIRTQPPPKTTEDGFVDIMMKMSRFDDMVRQRGKSLGMTDEQIGKLEAGAVPLKQQILKDVFKTINRGIDAWAGKTAEEEGGEGEGEEQPEVMETEKETASEKAARKRGEIPTPVETETEPEPPAPAEEILNVG